MPLLSNSCFIFAYVSVDAQQRVYIPQYEVPKLSSTVYPGTFAMSKNMTKSRHHVDLPWKIKFQINMISWQSVVSCEYVRPCHAMWWENGNNILVWISVESNHYLHLFHSHEWELNSKASLFGKNFLVSGILIKHPITSVFVSKNYRCRAPHITKTMLRLVGICYTRTSSYIFAFHTR
jgi:hypothetical protein